MATLDATITALKKGVTSMAAKTAVNNIEGWQKKLDESDKSSLKTLSKELDQLKDLLQEDEPDGKAIGKLMTKLGNQTSKAASGADEDEDKIKELGELLVKAGDALAKEDKKQDKEK